MYFIFINLMSHLEAFESTALMWPLSYEHDLRKIFKSSKDHKQM